jgi:membrane protein DedA with SNARE-associated domain
MEEAVGFFVEHGSYGLMIAALIAAGLGLPLPEDIVMISGAILAQQGVTNLWLTVTALAVGVFLGDTALFFVARRIGPAIYQWKSVKRVLPDARRKWLEEMIEKHGSLVVFCARHVAGFRGPTFAIAAIHGISYPRFIFWDMVALAISLPVWMSLGWFFSGEIDALMTHTATAERLFTVGALGLVLLIVVAHTIVSFVRRRRQDRAERAQAAADAPIEPVQLETPQGAYATKPSSSPAASSSAPASIVAVSKDPTT